MEYTGNEFVSMESDSIDIELFRSPGYGNRASCKPTAIYPGKTDNPPLQRKSQYDYSRAG